MDDRGSRTKWYGCAGLPEMAAPIRHFLGESKGVNFGVGILVCQ